jgi:hypothetical protein
MYKVIPEFISPVEQESIIRYVQEKIKSQNGTLQSYSNNMQKHGQAFEVSTEHIYYFPVGEEDDQIADIVKRMQDSIGVQHQNPNTYYGWVISITPNGTEVPEHVDPIDKSLKDKKIVRMNVLVRNATRGGLFDLKDCDGKWVTADIPDRALMVFDASEIPHRITKNLSNTTRINLSIDTVVDI